MAVSYGLDHIHLNASDLEATVSFYERLFGMRRIRSWEAGGLTTLQLDAGGARLNITAQPPDASQGVCAVDHFALFVSDLDGALHDLQGHGVAILIGPGQVLQYRYVFIQAPDGVRVEIISPATA